MLPDKFGNTALHVATRKKRAEIVNELLGLPDINVNALTRDHKTALDIAEELPLSEESSEIKEYLMRCGAVKANELNQPRDELRITVTEIKKDVHTQLEQTKRTNKNVHNISKELRKLHREGINNATNSVTVVAVLFATVAFAAIFTVPGDYSCSGGDESRKAIHIVGKRHAWAADIVTAVGGVIMAGVLGTMTYYVVKSKRSRFIRKRVKSAKRSGSNSWLPSDFSNSDVEKIYAL
ncbi:hypothetical protein MLD38_009783 [Melastoma candidum]|uniref:Uncharacterized protein n=1 Tax=Melastoma candidum TaxID=119954 RepID=A0ACB9RYM0_9MYRT|nr:hypothetical protein MLD38_009783 [Melastoma candidum]